MKISEPHLRMTKWGLKDKVAIKTHDNFFLSSHGYFLCQKGTLQPAWNSNLTPKPAANPRAGGKLPVTCENLPAEISASLLRFFFFLQCVKNIHILQVPGIKQLKKVRIFAQKTKKFMLTFIACLFICSSLICSWSKCLF